MASSIQSVGVADQTQTTTKKAGLLGKDDFLKLLITQMQNQDPLNPLSGADYAAQLAQFSSVEQLSNINTSLTESLDSNQLLTQAISNSLAATMVGKEVRVTGSAINYDGSSKVKLGYTLPSAADTVTVKIYNQSGALVRTFQNPGMTKGDTTFTWDGKDNYGQDAGAGKYTFKVEARDAKNATITTSPFLYGTIGSVRYKSDGAYFVIDGTEISLGSVLEIMKG